MQEFLDAAILSNEWIQDMANRAMLLEAHHTTHIEGTHLTLDQAERLLAGESVPEADKDDVCELLNYRDAIRFLLKQDTVCISDFEQIFPYVAKRTLQRDLANMINRGLVIQNGVSTNPNKAYQQAGLADLYFTRIYR